MKLEPELAQSIVNKMMSKIPYNINMMDENGYIIASGSSERLNTLHVGALDAIRQQKTLIMERSHGENGQPGVNMPVHFNDRIIGVIGITGEPNEVVPLASLLSTATELLLNQSYADQQKLISETSYNRFLYQWVQVEAKLETNQALLIDAQKLKIDIFRDRYAIVIKGKNLTNFPVDSADFKLLISSSNLIILTEFEGNIEKYKHSCSVRKLDIGIGKSTTRIGISVAEAQKTIELRHVLHDSKLKYYKQVHLIDKLLSSNLPLNNLVKRFAEVDQTLIGQELLQTLNAFIEDNGNISITSESLHIHRNTLNYRLKKIKEELHLDPHNYHDLFHLYIGSLYYAKFVYEQEQ
ncbi:CdaR family transcriptional regulator [Loigolactobacillus binensis]|uniref:CdaR family transcriptional regulator n=1 Tax=Loigolactobacillus binensis TaxID=2559922 RepID=A0ABW3EA54_9LACO|nr:sugar diacid recognition domain-containing protein [Loigolactobacillus binensis]